MIMNTIGFEFASPVFSDGEIKTLKLSEITEKYIVIIFYPHDFTFVCPTEVLGFSDNIEKFEALETKVLFCSTDSVYVHKAWMKVKPEDGGIFGNKFPMIGDIDRKVSKKFKMLDRKAGICFRGTVILDKNRSIKHYSIYDNSVGRNVDEIIRIVENLKHLDEHPDEKFCPVNFKL